MAGNEEVGHVVAIMRGVIEGIVKKPDEVKMMLGQGDRCVVLDVRVAQTDRGRIIGAGGKTIGALRVILGALGRGDVKYELMVDEGR